VITQFETRNFSGASRHEEGYFQAFGLSGPSNTSSAFGFSRDGRVDDIQTRSKTNATACSAK
jgi:hypothetical protein